MHKKFSQVIGLLQTSAMPKKESKAGLHSLDMDQAHALIDRLNIMGYLNEGLLGQAIDDLSLSKPFTAQEEQVVPNDTVKKDIFSALTKAKAADDKFVEVFLNEFAAEDYFKVTDILEIISYLYQTAYNREYGQERSQHRIAPGQPWMSQASVVKQFLHYADYLGLIAPIPPKTGHYCGIAIMGAASVRVIARLDYFLKYIKTDKAITYDHLFALTGYRRLSKDLDKEADVEEIVKKEGGALEYSEELVGTTKRQFAKVRTAEGAKDLLEVNLVNFLIQKKVPEEKSKIKVINSEKLAGNIRATTEDNAREIADLLVQSIKGKDKAITSSGDGVYHFMIVAEQPHLQRMLYQIQRAFNQQLEDVEGVHVIASGCGEGMSGPDYSSAESLAKYVPQLFNIASEMAAAQFERFSDVRKKYPSWEWRDTSHIIFNQRKAACEKAKAKLQAASSTASSATTAPAASSPPSDSPRKLEGERQQGVTPDSAAALSIFGVLSAPILPRSEATSSSETEHSGDQQARKYQVEHS